MDIYERTQTSRSFLVGTVALEALVLLGIFIGGDVSGVSLIGPIVAMVLVLILLWGATGLSVAVSPTEVRLRWRLGWPRKVIDRNEIVSTERIRNKWWYGWGIRLTPQGWMWNVWGLDAVKVNRSSGKAFVIGTDDPDGLRAAIGV